MSSSNAKSPSDNQIHQTDHHAVPVAPGCDVLVVGEVLVVLIVVGSELVVVAEEVAVVLEVVVEDVSVANEWDGVTDDAVVVASGSTWAA